METLDNRSRIDTETLDNRSRIDTETHDAHHNWIKHEISRRQRRDEQIQKFKLSFIGTLAAGLVGGLAWVGKLIADAIHRGTHG